MKCIYRTETYAVVKYLTSQTFYNIYNYWNEKRTFAVCIVITAI